MKRRTRLFRFIFRFHWDFFIHYVEACVRETGVIIHRYRGLSVLRHMESTALRLARRRRGGGGGTWGLLWISKLVGLVIRIRILCISHVSYMYRACILKFQFFYNRTQTIPASHLGISTGCYRCHYDASACASVVDETGSGRESGDCWAFSVHRSARRSAQRSLTGVRLTGVMFFRELEALSVSLSEFGETSEFLRSSSVGIRAGPPKYSFSRGRRTEKRWALLYASSQVYTYNRQPHTEVYRMCSGGQQWWKGVGGDDGAYPLPTPWPIGTALAQAPDRSRRRPGSGLHCHTVDLT